ncbi:MAG TPA: response regulator [Alphaproteobacteria bacterium]|nr:response regulator [Alphaproteobacteria bacterium]USO05785.1 MAG: response regulator [Rhodospirillales bacterium]HOO81796.1 response regulator [Alphaproteobacteria bacterium]
MSSALSDLKILLVEDQAEARAMIRNMMGELGITQIFEASDGREALTFLDSAYDFIDLLVCDWNMPGMTGVDLLRQLRSVDSTMPFLMVTGRIDMDSVVEAKSAGVTAYIRKPFSSKQLEAKLRIILHKIAA